MKLLGTLLLLTACAGAPDVQLMVHEWPRATCPAGAVQPVAPAAPRTVGMLADYANALRRALTITEDARTECARRFNLLMAVLRGD